MGNILKYVKGLMLAASLVLAPAVMATTPASPLFVNLTSNDAHRSQMAIAFSLDQLKLGHSSAMLF